MKHEKGAFLQAVNEQRFGVQLKLSRPGSTRSPRPICQSFLTLPKTEESAGQTEAKVAHRTRSKRTPTACGSSVSHKLFWSLSVPDTVCKISLASDGHKLDGFLKRTGQIRKRQPQTINYQSYMEFLYSKAIHL